MNINGKKIGIFIEDNYEDLEFWYPYLRLQEEGIKPLIIGPEIKTYKSKHGYQVKSDITAKKALNQSLEGIIIPGGYAPDKMRTDDDMIAIVKKLNSEKKLVAAICHAAWMLVSADIIDNRKITCFHSIKDDIKNAGANYHDESVVVDHHIITSRDPYDLPDFCQAILHFLNSN